MWEDVQSLIRASNENFEARLIEVSCRMQQMEENIARLQTQVSEHSETLSSSDSSSTTSSRKRKRKTPVSLQVCDTKKVACYLCTLNCNVSLEYCASCA